MELVLLVVIAIFAGASLGIVIILRRARPHLTSMVTVSHAPDPPTISVCIPARNEAHALSACLDRVLASDYERLEVLVLDDESVDQTPTLIKSFAHAGVRFIAGKPLPERWIGKNHALDTMAREASGDYILFLDVDVHIAAKTISHIVASMSTGSTLLSFIPERRDTLRMSAIFGSLRYLWDMLQIGLGGGSASASVWCVRREWLLDERHGFEPVKDVIRPELALLEAEDALPHLYLGSGEYDIAYEKHWRSQIESSGRLIVPTMRQYGIRGGAIVALISAWALMLPTALVCYAVWPTNLTIATVLIVFAIGYAIHTIYLSMAWRTRAWLGGLLWWWASLQEFVLIGVSIVQYATKTVTWKGRSIHAAPENDDYYSI